MKYKISDLPLRVFLDTTVVQNIMTFGEYIYDNYLSEELEAKLDKLSGKMKKDIEALRMIFGPVARSPLELLVSSLSLYELSKTGEPIKKEQLRVWCFELLEYDMEALGHSLKSLGPDQELLGSDYLPHKIDRLLIGECKRSGCKAFITTDYETILKHKKRLQKEGIDALSPSELWSLLQPWWSLWV